LLALPRKSLKENGAGEGNRTLVSISALFDLFYFSQKIDYFPVNKGRNPLSEKPSEPR
jgi:hypothetical protein